MSLTAESVVFDLNDYTEYLDLNRFQYCFVSYSGGVLAIATDTSLILTDDVGSSAYRSDELDGTRLVLEFNEDSGRATCIQWIIEGAVVSVGFESGLLVCFNCHGEEIFAFKGSNSSIQSIKVASTEIHKNEASIWVLYEGGYLVSFPVSHLEDRNTNIASYRLSSHKLVNDFVFLPAVYKASIFDLDEYDQLNSGGVTTAVGVSNIHVVDKNVLSSPNTSKKSHKRNPSHSVTITKDLLSIFTAGKESTLAIYNLGAIVYNESEKNTSNVRESTVNILSKGVMSLYNSLYGSTDATTTPVYKPDHQRVQESLITVAAKVEFMDTKRRVVKLSADPSGSYIVCSDVLGRVLLFDTHISAVVRIWKGLRHAELAWTTRMEQESMTTDNSASSYPINVTTSINNANSTANLVIHAPLLGLVYIYRVPHGECIRIVPVGLNCHILSLNTPPYSTNSDKTLESARSDSGVRAYLLKPHADTGTLELSEIRPSDRTETDLDVRLTLVGDEEGSALGDFEEDGQEEVVPFDDEGITNNNNNGADPTHPADAVPHLHLPTSYNTNSSPTQSSRSATDVYAMRNIEQSLKLLVDCIPMAALYSHLHTTVSASANNIYLPLDKGAFDMEVQRAEESILETLSAHRSVLSLSSLYKCVCLIENVELYGTLLPPTNITTTSTATYTGDMNTLLHDLASSTTDTKHVHNGTNTGTSFVNLMSEQSAASLQSCASDNSISNHDHITDSDGANTRSAMLGKLAAGLVRYPVFSVQLHKTLLTLLDTALKNHANKYQYDIHTGTITHLPAAVLEYVTAELPLRLQLLSAFDTLRSISDATNTNSSGIEFNSIPSLNIRNMFEKAAPTTASSTINSLNNTLLGMSAASNQGSTNKSTPPLTSAGTTTTSVNQTISSTAETSTFGKSVTDEISALVKGNNIRSEATMWALRAAQNDELQAISKGTKESTSGKHDRNTSSDSVSSYRSLPNNMYTIHTSASTPTTATPNVSVSADHPSVDLADVAGSAGIAVNANAHSKVKRFGHTTPPPRSPMTATNKSDAFNTNTIDSGTLLSTFRRNGSGGNLIRMSSRGSLTNDNVVNSTTEYEYKLSFSVFRAFVSVHRPIHTLPANTANNSISTEMYQYYSPLPPILRTTSLLRYVAEAEHFFFGNIRCMFDAITSVHDPSHGTSAVGSPSLSPSRKVNFNSNDDVNNSSATAMTLLHALTLSNMSIEACKPIVTTTSTAKSVTKENATFAPNITIPHSLLHTLVTPLLGDVFSLSNYTSALATMGIKGHITPIMHISPMFVAHIAHQNISFLLTDVMCKKLSVFPYQRWLRDSLLSFQDALSVHMNNLFTASANRNTSADTSVGGSFRVNVTSSAEKDARDIMFLSRISSNNNSDTLYSSSFHHSNYELNGDGTTDGTSDVVNEISILAEEIRHTNRRDCERAIATNEAASTANTLRLNSMEQATPSYNDFVRHILRPAYLFCTTCPNLEAVLVFASIVLETLQIVNEQVERRTYGAMSLQTISTNNGSNTSVNTSNSSNTGVSGKASSTATSASSTSINSVLCSSSGTIPIWEGLIKQVRVALLLQSRKGADRGTTDSGSNSPKSPNAAAPTARSFTLHALSTGLISTHRLLAADTLAFALRAEQALEHEDKCREVYNRSVQNAAGGGAQANANKAEVLLAYGPSADRRWKDLLSVAVAEDAILAANKEIKKAQSSESTTTNTAASDEQKRSVRKRRPVLLYFPAHSQPHYLGAYRSILLTERWSLSIHRVEVLVSAVQHLFSLPPHSYRPCVATFLYSMYVFPVVQVLMRLEENSSLLAWVSEGHSIATYIETAPMDSTTGGGDVPKISDLQVQNLLKLVADNRLLKAFVNAGAELLGYIETAVQSPTSPAAAPTPALNKTTTSAHTNNSHFLWQHPHVQHALSLHRAAEHRSVYHNEFSSGSCWPGCEDMFVNTLLLRFVEQSAGPHDNNCTSATTAASPLWNLLLLSEHISRLWTLHIRSLCGLRSIKPSQIMGKDVHKSMQAFWVKYTHCGSEYALSDTIRDMVSTSAKVTGHCTISSSLSSHYAVSDAERMMFLSQCLKQLVNTRQPTGVVYVLVLRWLSMPGLVKDLHVPSHSTSDSVGEAQMSAVLSMDAVRLQHLNILLAAGGGSRDEEAEQMVHQISHTDVVMDTLIEALRARLGGILSVIDQLPSFGPLIAAMDAEAVVWARNSVQHDVGRDVLGLTAGATDANNTGSELAVICKHLNVNIASTRHLIICVQSTLMNVPINMRTAGEASSNSASVIGIGTKSVQAGTKNTWFERKTKCDALLTLCKYFAQQLSQVKG